MTESKYYDVVQTAELVRLALKKNFPGIKFSVRSSKYAGGASIDVRWTLGPTTREVDAVAGQYESADFDGMIDLQTHKSHWLLPDGSTIIRDAPGTQGSLGVIPAEHNPPPQGAVPVSFGAHYVQCQRRFGERWEDENRLRDQIARDMCALQRVEWQGDHTTNLFGEVDQEPVTEHAWRLLEATSFKAGEQYAGVRYAADEERDEVSRTGMMVVKKVPEQNNTPKPVGSLAIQENKELDGLEIRFRAKPEDSIIAQLKNNGWRWNRKKRLWFNRLTEDNKRFAGSLTASAVQP